MRCIQSMRVIRVGLGGPNMLCMILSPKIKFLCIPAWMKTLPPSHGQRHVRSLTRVPPVAQHGRKVMETACARMDC